MDHGPVLTTRYTRGDWMAVAHWWGWGCTVDLLCNGRWRYSVRSGNSLTNNGRLAKRIAGRLLRPVGWGR